MSIKEKEYLQQKDPILGGIIASIPELQYENTHLVFHDLMSCILEQQIHYRSSKKIFQKMLDASGVERLTPENFSDFERTAFEGRKISEKKYETIANVLDYWNATDVDWKSCSEEEVRARLSEIKGVGTWTIDMILLFTLNHPNVFCPEDFHIKQIMTSLYGLNPATKLRSQMMEVAEAWSPYRSLAFHYLLAWKEHQKGIK